MRFLNDLKIPLPKAFRTTAEYALNSHLRRAFAEELESRAFTACSRRLGSGGVDLDATTLEYTLRKTIEGMAGDCGRIPGTDSIELRALREAIA